MHHQLGWICGKCASKKMKNKIYPHKRKSRIDDFRKNINNTSETSKMLMTKSREFNTKRTWPHKWNTRFFATPLKTKRKDALLNFYLFFFWHFLFRVLIEWIDSFHLVSLQSHFQDKTWLPEANVIRIYGMITLHCIDICHW